jgi:uncharacterized protein YqjF (DUF2071 family)
MNWSQRWLDCLFLHFPVPASELAPLVPPRLEVETLEGSAWVSYVAFHLRLRPAWLPPLPVLSSLAELNIRTYVRHRGQSGICFLRVLADNPLAIAAARMLTPMPYRFARFTNDAGKGKRQIVCPTGQQLVVSCQPPTGLFAPCRGTLDEWLLERYRLYIGGPQASLLAADVVHPPWPAALVAPLVSENTLLADLGLALPPQPAAAHYSPGVAAQFRAFHTVAGPIANSSRSSAAIPVRAAVPRGGR